MEEIWKNYDDWYQISNLGRVKSIKRLVNHGKFKYIKKEKILKFSPNASGYFHVKIYKGDASFGRDTVHRMVAKAFIPNPNNLPFVNHINGNKIDNRVENLQWSSHSDNIRHAYSNNLIDMTNRIGENSKASILTNEIVLQIRQEHSVGSSLKILSKKYNTSPSNISSIVRRKTWKHI